MDDIIAEIECILIHKQHGVDDWTAILEPARIPQGVLSITFPYPDDVQAGDAVFLRIVAK